MITAEIESMARPLASLAAVASTVADGDTVVDMDSVDEARTTDLTDEGLKALAVSASREITTP